MHWQQQNLSAIMRLSVHMYKWPKDWKIENTQNIVDITCSERQQVSLVQVARETYSQTQYQGNTKQRQWRNVWLKMQVFFSSFSFFAFLDALWIWMIGLKISNQALWAIPYANYFFSLENNIRPNADAKFQ